MSTKTGLDRLTAALEREGGIDPPSPVGSRGFGSGSLRINGKIFAMPVQGDLVLKLPRDRVTALVEAGRGTRFDPGHGRVMKEWIVLSDSQEKNWLALAREAREFVKARRE